MDENLKHWFKGFENALAHMEQKERESLFSECGKNCADRWVMHLYNDLYQNVHGDMDRFFQAINSAEDVKGEIVEAGRNYSLIFKKCTCGMHRAGYINSPFLCECSRQSIIYVFNRLMPDTHVDVEIGSTVLRGGDACRFSIRLDK